jgi:hypothetical protein
MEKENKLDEKREEIWERINHMSSIIPCTFYIRYIIGVCVLLFSFGGFYVISVYSITRGTSRDGVIFLSSYCYVIMELIVILSNILSVLQYYFVNSNFFLCVVILMSLIDYFFSYS